MDERQQQQVVHRKQEALPALPMKSRSEFFLIGGTAAVAIIWDAMAGWDPWVFIVTASTAGAAFFFSEGLVQLPKLLSGQSEWRWDTSNMFDFLAPPVYTHPDQSFKAKMRRSFPFLQPKPEPEPSQPKEATDEEEDADFSSEDVTPEAMPKSTRQAVVTRTEEKVTRLTIEQIVSKIEPNSFKVYIGKSLTKPGNPPVQIGFYKQHFKFIGASQRGKSAMAAAFLDIVTRTHDPEHLLIALLDLEDQTSKLFADLPHVAEVATDKGYYLLHARSHKEVLHRLRLIMLIMDERYAMSKTQILQEPVLLVYVEEFLALKDHFKNLISGKKDEEKKKAERDYADLIFCISEIARRGLKVRIQLLLCAQVNYRDEDLQEALINVVAGMSFAVLPSAAQAAGFYDHAMLKQCARNDKVGEAVTQTPDCKDLILAPEYDLEQKLIDLEKASAVPGQKKADSILGARNGRKQSVTRNERDLRPDESGVEVQDDTRDFARNTQRLSSGSDLGEFDIYAQQNAVERPVEQAQPRYVLDKMQTEIFCVAYELTGNTDESLKKAGAHTGYRAHARQIIAERGLKRS